MAYCFQILDVFHNLCDAFAHDEDSEVTNKNSAAHFSAISFTEMGGGRFHLLKKKKKIVLNQMGKSGLVVKNRGQLANSSNRTVFIL